MSLPSILKSRKSMSVTECNPTYKVLYLGNVQTVMAKGDNCADKPLTILWKNYKKKGAGAKMKVTVCTSGMQAITKAQGLTHYWAHRITYCIAHPNFPRVFCWIYRHEGKKMKVDLRCHAVLCRKDTISKALTVQLYDATTAALREFMREKLRRQNYRLLLKSKVGLVATTPRRKLILSAAKNFKPPLEKSRSAPKLKSIDETPLEEDELFEEEEVMAHIDFEPVSRRIRCLSLQESVLQEEDAIVEEDDVEVFLDELVENRRLSNGVHEHQDLDSAILYLRNVSDELELTSVAIANSAHEKNDSDLQLHQQPAKLDTNQETSEQLNTRPVPPPRRKKWLLTRHLSLEKEEKCYEDDTGSLHESAGDSDVCSSLTDIAMECGNDVESFKEDESLKHLLMGDSSPEPADDDDDDGDDDDDFDNISDESGYSEGDSRLDTRGTVIRICQPDKVLSIKLNGVSHKSKESRSVPHNDKTLSEALDSKSTNSSDSASAGPYSCVISF